MKIIIRDSASGEYVESWCGVSLRHTYQWIKDHYTDELFKGAVAGTEYSLDVYLADKTKTSLYEVLQRVHSGTDIETFVEEVNKAITCYCKDLASELWNTGTLGNRIHLSRHNWWEEECPACGCDDETENLGSTHEYDDTQVTSRRCKKCGAEWKTFAVLMNTGFEFNGRSYDAEGEPVDDIVFDPPEDTLEGVE